MCLYMPSPLHQSLLTLPLPATQTPATSALRAMTTQASGVGNGGGGPVGCGTRMCTCVRETTVGDQDQDT